MTSYKVMTFQLQECNKARGTSSRFVSLQDDTDETARALVDDALKRLAELEARVVRHVLELCLQVFVHDLVEAAAEDVGLPDLRRVALELLQEVVDHVFALLFIADDGRTVVSMSARMMCRLGALALSLTP